MKILVACEESQAVTKELRKLGHEAYSCDIIPCSGGHPEWHLQVDALELLKMRWDMILAFPPCTYLTCTGNKWFKPEYADRFPTRRQDRKNAIDFFMAFANADCQRICIENPVGIMSTRWRKPDQIIQPYYFGHEQKKTTCLWLKGLPHLAPTNMVKPKLHQIANGKYEPQWHMDTMHLPAAERSRQRSKTFPGIARAMAEQWAGQIKEPTP
jgi:hypothetical protein